MTRTATSSLCLLFSGLTLLGCSEDVDSDDIRTSGFYAEFMTVSSGDGSTDVTARLKIGGNNSNTFADLQGDDELIASATGDEKRMSRRGSTNRSPYETSFDTDEGGTEIRIALERGDADDGAPDSVVELPEPFELSLAEQSEGAEIQRGQRVLLEWDNETNGRMAWEVDGDCIWSRDGSVADKGSLRLDGDDIEVQSLDEGEDCEVTITLERSNQGDLDPALGGGEFVAIQRRTISFVSTPSDEEASLDGMGGGS